MKFRNIVAAAALLAQATLAIAGSLAGDTIDASMNFSVDTGYGIGRISGFGLDAPFTVLNGDADKQQYSGAFTIDVDGAGFDLRYLTFGGWQEGIVLRLTSLDFRPLSGLELSKLTITSNVDGYSVSAGDRFLEVAMGGTSYDERSFLSVAFNTSPVPEPASATIFSIALLTLAVFRVRAMRRLRSAA